MSWFIDQFSEDIYNAKYKGDTVDIKELFSRLARLVALGDAELEKKFFDLMWQKKFSPGGRILAYGSRPNAKLSLMNCTTHKVTGDSLEEISKTVYTIMRASSRGQGIGVDISNLRPAGSPVNNAASTSTGAISFMEMFNSVGATIGQEGRRAAMLFSISDHHPDLYRPGERTVPCPMCEGMGCGYCNDGFIPYDFLHVKKIPGKVESANISVMISDAFMQAVEKNSLWHLYFKGKSGKNDFSVNNLVPARELFMALAKSARSSAEPGILFWDNSKRMSNSDLFGERWEITGTNACSEEILDQDGVCNLGSMNLAAYVLDPFTASARFDYTGFAADVYTATEFLDNVVSIEIMSSASVSKEQAESLVYLRRLGLGVMGMADMLAMLDLRYEHTVKTQRELRHVFSTLRNAAYEKSILLAKEKGPAKVWDDKENSQVLDGGYFSMLPAHIIAGIMKHGIRNITLLSLAPTGTISNLFGVSSGIEPLFARHYTRRTRINGKDRFVDYVHPGVLQARDAGRPDGVYQTAYEVGPYDHISIQAIVQEFIDASIAKTVNMPSTTTDQDVADIYMAAWRAGLKGLSIYVDQSRKQQVLYTLPEEETCPDCGGELTREEGCTKCPACGWGKCSI